MLVQEHANRRYDCRYDGGYGAEGPGHAPILPYGRPATENECLAVVQTLNEQAKKLSRQTKEAVPQSLLGSQWTLSSHAALRRAWISIEWMNGCLNNFTKDAELGFCSRNEGYPCAIKSGACPQRR